MPKYTDLEKKQINDLYNVAIDRFNKPRVKDVDNITNHMIHSLYYDNRVNNIYNKKHIMTGTLKKIFNHPKIYKSQLSVIDMKLYNMSRKKLEDKRKSCSCIIC